MYEGGRAPLSGTGAVPCPRGGVGGGVPGRESTLHAQRALPSLSEVREMGNIAQCLRREQNRSSVSTPCGYGSLLCFLKDAYYTFLGILQSLEKCTPPFYVRCHLLPTITRCPLKHGDMAYKLLTLLQCPLTPKTDRSACPSSNLEIRMQ